MPQLNPEFFTPQLFWLLITFSVLFVVLAKSVLPRIAGVLEERELRIGSDLEKAQQLKEEAEKVLTGEFITE